MAKSIAVIFGFLAVTIHTVSSVKPVNEKVHITMGTASGCSNARNFIINQLWPTYELYGDFMEIEFVPWGRTVKNLDGSMTCQFGGNDCWANRLHRCVLDRLKSSTLLKLRYMVCEFTSPFPAFGSRSYACVQTIGLNVREMERCVNNPQLDSLDEEAQAKAVEPMRVINWVPFVLFNDVIDEDIHWAAHSNLKGIICQALLDDPDVAIRDC